MPPLLHQWGKFGMLQLPHAKFHPISAICHPCGAKTSKCNLHTSIYPVGILPEKSKYTIKHNLHVTSAQRKTGLHT